MFMDNFMFINSSLLGCDYQIVKLNSHKVTISDMNSFHTILQMLDSSIYDYYIHKKK